MLTKKTKLLSLLLSCLSCFIVESRDNFNDSDSLSLKNTIQNESLKNKTEEVYVDKFNKKSPTSIEVESAIAEAQSIFEKIEDSENWISSFSNNNGLMLPAGIKQIVNEVEYQLAFAEAQFGIETVFKVFVKVVLPQSDKDGKPIELFFGADNVKLSKQGGLIGNSNTTGNANLILLENTQIAFHASNWVLSLKGSPHYTNATTQNTSYVSIDCNGITGMSIDGEVHISRSLLIPVQSNGQLTQNETDRVSGTFTTTAASWNDLIVDIDLPPFVLANQEDRFMFTSNEAIFDFSDGRNPEGITFPQQYQDQGVLLPDENTWRGIHIKSLQIGLPKVFKSKQSIQANDRVYFDATDLVIDNNGVSGNFFAENVISIEDGITSEPVGWSMSVSEISLELLNNSIVESKFSGGMRLPIFEDLSRNTSEIDFTSYNDDNGILPEDKDTSLLEYEGMISDDEYSTNITALNEMKIPAFLASVKMRAGSYIKMPVEKDDAGNVNFRPETNLNGIMTTIISSKRQREASENATYSYDTDLGKTEDETDMVRFHGITFKGLKMKTTKKYMDIKYFGYTEGLSFGTKGMQVLLDGITYKTNPEKNEDILGFDISFELSNRRAKDTIRKKEARKESLLIQAMGSLDIVSESVITEDSEVQYKYKALRVAKIAVKGRIFKLKFKGIGRVLYDDPVYGNAVAVDAEGKWDFKSTSESAGEDEDEDNSETNIRIKTKLIFSRDDVASYWFADGSVELPVGINVAPNLMLNGFSIGFYNNMRRRMDPSYASAKVSPSGFSYEPSPGSFGFKMMLFGYSIKKEFLRAGAGLELNINKSGGINSISLVGQLRGLNKVDNPNFPFKKKLSKQVYEKDADGNNTVKKDKGLKVVKRDENGKKIQKKDEDGNLMTNSSGKPIYEMRTQIESKPVREQYDRVTKGEIRDDRSLSEKIAQEETGTESNDIQSMPDADGVDAYIIGQIDFQNSAFYSYLDIYVDIAKGIIIGKGRAKKAGEGIMIINKDEWYAHLGNPVNRNGFSAGFGDLRVDIGGYAMMGQNLPKATPPPYRVANILGDKLRTLEAEQNRNDHSISAGQGAAFGVGLEFDTGNLNFGPLYARFTAGIGFDAMIKKYNNTMTCNGISPIGSNGFYATGQFYAYMQGELGIGFKFFGDYRRFPIIKGGGAFLGRMGGPNPFWFQARFAANLSLLGGMVKIKVNEDIQYGEVCNPVPDNGLNIEIISDFTPSDKDTNIDVFTSPQLALTMAANTPIELPNTNDEIKTYKIKVKTFTITDSNGNKILGEQKWNPENDRVTFESMDILPPNQELKAKVEVVLQEKIDGIFRTFKVNGEEYVEERNINFTTGDAPSYIPLENIEYAYPVVGQKLFYRNEHPTGYLKLKKGQDYLFENSQWETNVKYINVVTNTTKETQLQYNNTSNQLSYNIPKVEKKTDYTIKMVSAPKTNVNTSQGFSDNDYSVNNYNSEGTAINVRKNKAQAVVREDSEIERLTYDFSSSNYNTFRNKMQSININNNFVGKVYVDAVYLSSTIAAHEEGFDVLELEGTKYSGNKPLIIANSTLEDEYFKKDIAPLLYNNYPIAGKYSFNRDTNVLGIAPSKAISVRTNYLASLKNNTDTEWRLRSFPYKYMLPKAYRDDYEDIMVRISNDYHDGVLSGGDNALQFLDNRFGFMREGKYKTRLSYVLPGGIRKSYAMFEFEY
ncbi:hypothetical protein [Aquimarina algiphila]|uniref:hypothetical protein n=1 Tax=Aquimarina algiphila TaxID=2047982 RepID=UPI00232E98A9|nr:hypothetical protein [Aquimarina algiphila]